MYTDTESEILKGRLTKGVKVLNDINKFIAYVNEFIAEHQAKLEWSVKEYAISLVDRGPCFTLSAWMEKSFDSKLALIIGVTSDPRIPPRYVIKAMQLWSPLVLSFESLPVSKRKVIGRWVEHYFDTEHKETFFINHPDCKP
jgi:hypothetical protein